MRPPKNTAVLFLFLALGTALYWPYITTGFALDDFFWLSILEERIPFRRWVGFWDVNAAEFVGFRHIWWADATSDFGTFWRPLYSLIFEGFFKWLGRSSAPALHLFTILLHSMVAFTAYRMISLLSQRKIVSFVAAILFLISEDHSMTVGWISTSTDLLAVLFMNISVLLYISFRTTGNSWLLALSVAGCIGALSGKETAVVTPVAIFLYEGLVQSRRSGADTTGQVLTYLRRTSPAWGLFVALIVVYLFLYRSLGFGIQSLAYYDPLKSPGIYASHALSGLGVLLAGWLTPIPIGLTLFVDGMVKPVALAGALTAVVFAAALWPLRRDTTVQWAALLFFASVLPQLSADASERQLYYPMIPGCYLLAVAIFRNPVLAKAESMFDNRQAGGWFFSRALPVLLIASSGIAALILSFYYSFAYRKSLSSPEVRVIESLRVPGVREARSIIYLNAPDPFFPFYANDIFRYHLGRYANVFALSGFYGRIEIRRTSAKSFALRTDRPGWIGNMFARIVRQNPRVKDAYPMPGFTVIPIRTVASGGIEDVLEAEFRLDTSSASDETIILYYDGSQIRRWSFSSEEKTEWTTVADTSDVLQSMRQ